MESPKVKTFALVVLALVSSGSVWGAQATGLPSGWVETSGPAGSAPDDQHLPCATYSENEWQVSAHGSDLRIVDIGSGKRVDDPLPAHFVRTKEMQGRAKAVKVDDGWLIGFDGGQFGGGLWWTDAEGRQSRQLTGENVRVILRRGQEALVLTGLAHMDSDHGAIFSYRAASGGAGDFVRIADLGSAPAAATFRSGGALLIAAEARVLELTADNQLHVVLQNGGMSLLFPNSIIEGKDGSIFVGMRFYVLELHRGEDHPYEASWFVRSRCVRTKISDFRCVCVGGSSDK